MELEFEFGTNIEDMVKCTDENATDPLQDMLHETKHFEATVMCYIDNKPAKGGTMKAKIQKALDLNKLFNDQAQGKLLKKHISFPIMASTKFDGNYTVIIKDNGHLDFITSGGHYYTNDKPSIFDSDDVEDGVYFAERIGTDGKLGDRTTCALRGTRDSQVAYGHTYMVFDCIELTSYDQGYDTDHADDRYEWLTLRSGIPRENIVTHTYILSQEHLEEHLSKVVKEGYEGLMLKNPSAGWKDTKSRTVDLVKYKKRPTADLLCVGTVEGKGKYKGMIGALVLADRQDRIVHVGAGLSDVDRGASVHRCISVQYYIGEVIEIEYEQIIDTYIQPSFIRVRKDKTVEEID